MSGWRLSRDQRRRQPYQSGVRTALAADTMQQSGYSKHTLGGTHHDDGTVTSPAAEALRAEVPAQP